VSTALFGSTEVFGSTTGGKTQGKTGQGVRAAIFFTGDNRGGEFSGANRTGRKRCQFPPPRDTSTKKRPRPMVVRPKDVRMIKRREPMTSVGQVQG
jgi:hypothetical protein